MVAVVITAAGSGERLGPGAPKAHRLIAGKPLFWYSLCTFVSIPEISHVIVVARDDELGNVRDSVEADEALVFDHCHLDVVAGGETRQESVARGLAALDDQDEFVLVHDAARALVPRSVVESVIAQLKAGREAVIPVVAVTDSMREFDGTDVGAVVPRSHLVAVQTPQGFTRDVVLRAHREVGARSGVAATDDASLVELLGIPIVHVDGSPDAFKVTYANDLLLAESLIAERKGVQA